jgi:DNA-binding CsgD family transcriptional regulator
MRSARDSTEKAVPALTDRERQIIGLVSEGLSNKEIGRRLKITDGTVKVHLHTLFEKLEVSNRTALAVVQLRTEKPDHQWRSVEIRAAIRSCGKPSYLMWNHSGPAGTILPVVGKQNSKIIEPKMVMRGLRGRCSEEA